VLQVEVWRGTERVDSVEELGGYLKQHSASSQVWEPSSPFRPALVAPVINLKTAKATHAPQQKTIAYSITSSARRN
jgi:hypothetical protein